jgi:hypothetical protein
MDKHKKTWSDNQHVFIRFAFVTFGFLEPEAVDPLENGSKVVLPKFMDMVFQMLKFTIEKDLVTRFIVRLLFIIYQYK